MNTHEYQAKKILKRYGIEIPDFAVAESVEEVKRAVEDLDLDRAVVKIQVHAGGRGKAGGVKFAKGRAEIPTVAKSLIGMKASPRTTSRRGTRRPSEALTGMRRGIAFRVRRLAEAAIPNRPRTGSV